MDDFGDFMRQMFGEFVPRRRTVRARIFREPPPPLATIGVDRQSFFDGITPYAQEPELRLVLVDSNDKFLHEFTVRGGGRFNKDFLPQFYDGESGTETFIPNQYGASQIKVYRPQQLTGINLEQVFRDSVNNICVFEAIRRKFAELPESENKKTNQNRRSRLNKVNEVEKDYPDGVTADQLEELADKVKVKFVLQDVLKDKIKEFGKSRQIEVKIVNTRKNHVDYLTSNEVEHVSREFLDEHIAYLRRTNQHYLIKNSTQTITNLSTAEHNYILENPNAELMKEMNAQVKYVRFDANKYPELNDFTKRGRVINSSFLHLEDFTENTKLYDMKAAYTKHRDCPFYNGFLGQIQQFRSIDHMPFLGIYQFTLESDSTFSRKFGLIKGHSYILPSPEIKFWRQCGGLDYTITAGCWGSCIDLSYSPEIIQKKLYQKWAGSLSMNDNYRNTKHTFPSTPEFAQHIKTLYPETFYWETGEASVNIPNKQVKVAHHVLAFITSYTRINMLMELQTLNNIQGVLLDGIYTTDTITNPLFQTKPVVEIDSTLYEHSIRWYEPTDIIFTPPPVHLLVSSVLSGSGGSGKTHSILNDTGYINPLYVVPTHELGNGKNYTTIHQLIGQGCRPYIEKSGPPPVILIDELTMIPADYITRALQMYPDALFFLAGDLDDKQHYQCRSGNPTEYWDIWKPTLPIVNYTNDYRSKTPELKHRKEHMREEMRRIYTDGGLKDTREMREYVMEHYPIITFKEAIKQATQDDIFLWSTKRVESTIPEHLNKLGVHKSQGLTLSNPKVFITMDWFEYAMSYTALSRCVDHRQVQFVCVL